MDCVFKYKFELNEETSMLLKDAIQGAVDECNQARFENNSTHIIEFYARRKLALIDLYNVIKEGESLKE